MLQGQCAALTVDPASEAYESGDLPQPIDSEEVCTIDKYGDEEKGRMHHGFIAPRQAVVIQRAQQCVPVPIIGCIAGCQIGAEAASDITVEPSTFP